MKKSENKTVYVGLSGGVDSSVSAALLKEAGYNVIGVFIRAWYPEFIHCTWREDRRDAMRVCAQLEIPFKTINLEKEYRDEVVEYMLDEYKKGRTPNPDVMCNTKIKFGHFFDRARNEGADFVATGHYARIEGSQLKVESGKRESYKLLESVDKEKDQSYFLWNLTQDKLAHTLFPVGEYKKNKVRKLARQFDLPTADKKDSQGLCFLGAVDMKEFLSRYVDVAPGKVLDTEGGMIGEHDGAILYTIGERRGFTITDKSPEDKPRYVIAKDIDANTITVDTVDPGTHAVMNTKQVTLANTNWIRTAPEQESTYKARIRYRETKGDVRFSKNEGVWNATFQEKQPSVSLGQSLVAYDGEECIGGGIIESLQ